MRPIRRFGSSNGFSDRLRNHEKSSITSFNRSFTPTIIDDRRRSNGLFYSNTYAEVEKENDKKETNDKPEVIINTPSFQLICDRRRTQPRHASADESINESKLKGVLKKPQNGDDQSPEFPHRSRWTAFSRRSVSFADDKGLQLAQIRTFDLCPSFDNNYDYTSSSFSFSNRQLASGFMADFILPPPYRRLRRLQDSDLHPSQIVLESYTANRWNVQGVIAARKLNGMCNKAVFVRYTSDHWLTWFDTDATPISDIRAADPSIQRYAFTLTFPPRPQIGARFEFKLGIKVPGDNGLSATEWDENGGSNYGFTFV